MGGGSIGWTKGSFDGITTEDGINGRMAEGEATELRGQ
jgi:hypothetical protein